MSHASTRPPTPPSLMVTEVPTPKPVLGVSVCVWRGEEMLLIRRGKPPAKGLWAPVGGRVEWGETLAEAARREVREETSVTCEIVGFSQLREMVQPASDDQIGHHVVLAVFAARWIAGVARAGDDAEAAEWVGVSDFGRFSLVPGVMPYIEATKRLIEGLP